MASRGSVRRAPSAIGDHDGYRVSLGQSRTLTLREAYPADSTSVPEARQDIARCAAAAGATAEQLDAIRLACSEALTNVVLYAYWAQPGHIHVTARAVANEFWVLIADSGCGIHAGPDSDRLGLGLALIADMTDGFAVVERSTGGTEVRLRFLLDGAPPS
jgi:anti-sigma regulatory factor (Ser/Thr protein kinase)